MMAESAQLIEAIARFTGDDVTAFRNSLEASRSKPKEVEKHLQSKNVLASGISVGVEIEYTSLSGNHQDRNVIIRRVIKSGNELFLDAFCQEIKAPRLIKVSAISRIVDKKSNETFSDAELFLEDILGIDLGYRPTTLSPTTAGKALPSGMAGEMKTAIDRTRNELTALLFVSGMDGVRDQKELNQIADYVHRRCPDLTFDNDELFRYLRLIYPDSESFYYSLERILGQDGWIVKLFLEHLMKLIAADGVIHDKEKLFLAEFLRVLEGEGFDVEFKSLQS